ncbi:MAG: AAA family ATPase [Treponema sp.]|nr:AAA family ATPase [Treponema sp.]
MIERLLEKTILEKLPKGKIIVLVGPRQVGKTTLLKSVLQKRGKRALFWNCDEPDIREILQNATSTRLKNLAGNAELIIIDEAQRIKDIGITIKLMAENFSGVQVAVTGSSALEFSNSINEYMLSPLSCGELCRYYGTLEEKRLLKGRLIYGAYPEIVTKPEEKRELPENIVSSYLFKDVFVFQDMRKSDTEPIAKVC